MTTRVVGESRITINGFAISGTCPATVVTESSSWTKSYESKKDGHQCLAGPDETDPRYYGWHGHGSAIDSCEEVEDGSFWVGNGEYGSRVNFCPYCGKKAPK